MKVVVLLLFIFIGYLEAFLQRSNFGNLYIIPWALLRSAKIFRFSGLKSFSTSKLQAVQITVKPEEPVESILRRFKKAVNKQGYLWELRYKDAHETSLEKLKRKKMVIFAVLYLYINSTIIQYIHILS